MRYVSSYPRPIREIMTEWIPMADGCRLAARIWLPVDAEDDPVPAVLEYLPYRRRDGTASRDAITQPYLAGHGYAAIRVDIRGTGDSDGVMRDEYDLPEQHDGGAVVEWLARQPWCNGNVGMWGISWGGFNALQVAALAPPALKAIIPIGFAHDRYDGDCHYMGGCVLEGNISWGNTLLAGLSRPPDPAVVGPGWRDAWLKRLDAMEQPIEIWLKHQRRDDYWKPGSVCEDYSRIKAAVYAVSGWQDSYSRNVLPLLGALQTPKRGLVGPWAHSWPHLASPGPSIGFLQEAIRWWDHWLKGIDTGIMEEPMLRVWMGEWTPPRKFVPVWPGRWVEERAWPSPRLADRHFHLGVHDLLDAPSENGSDIPVSSPCTLGQTAGYQCSYGAGPDLADDQRIDDALSVVFDSPPLRASCTVLGEPFVEVEITCDRPQAQLAVRLCDVAPDGSSLRVSYGLLNLSHRDDHGSPTPLQPGQSYSVRIPLCGIAYRFGPDHRIRLAISTTYWPIAFPAPQMATVVLRGGTGRLALPVRPDDPAERPAAFQEPEGAKGDAIVEIRPRQTERPQDRVVTDPATGEVVVSRDRDRGAWRAIDAAVDYDATGQLTFSVHPDEPLSARQEFSLTTTLGRPGWRIRTAAYSRLSATSSCFVLRSHIEVFEGEELVFQREWNLAIPRDQV